MSIIKFSGQKTSDQKRLVRGEQLLLARSCLRSRDAKHNAPWRVLTMAGGSPQGEIIALRELMSRAYVVAVDRETACLDAAIEAGVDDVVHCDLTAWETEHYMKPSWESVDRPGQPPKWPGETQRVEIPMTRDGPPAAIRDLGPFDLMNLDLCGGVNETARLIVKQYRRLLTRKGVMIVTFSYGRDVLEVFVTALRKFHNPSIEKRFEALKIPDGLAGRLVYLLSLTDLRNLGSIMVYRGNEMPMCSVLFTMGNDFIDKPSYVKVARGDFELAVAYPDAAKLYDCPQKRIESLRRQFAAGKAVITRRAKAQATIGDPTLFDDEVG